VSPRPNGEVEATGADVAESTGVAKGKNSAVLFNCSHCDYDVIFAAGKARGWRVVKTDKLANRAQVHWIDDGAIRDWLPKTEPWMKINHFPGTHNTLARKGRLAQNMSRMTKIFPKEYKFIPTTWLLPHDLPDLEKKFQTTSKAVYIVKPDNGTQGRGIFLTNDLEKIKGAGGHWDEPVIVQMYIPRPMLLDGLKFDLRLYLLVCSNVTDKGLDPILFFFRDGLVRLCTTPYQAPTKETMEQRCMHLTNYAINKKKQELRTKQQQQC